MLLREEQIAKFQKIFPEEADRLSNLFGALADRNRLRILRLFLERAGICVRDVAKILDISVSAASQHLKLLELTNIVKHKKLGQMCCYEINQDDKMVASLIKLII